MCVIIHQPRDAHLEKKRAKRLWDINSDGGGFAFINDAGSIETYRFMEFKEFWPTFENVRSEQPQRDYLLHMRIATHGTVDLNNVHPFTVNEGMVMAHNGIIRGVPDFRDGRSDTKVFIDEVLPRLPENWLDDVYLTEMVEEWIGWSKLMFLTNNPDLEKSVYILNKRSGLETDGMWFSNTHGVNVWKKPKTTKALPASTVTYAGQRNGGYPKVTKTTKEKRRQFAGEQSYTPPSRPTHYQEGSEDWANWLEQERRADQAWEERVEAGSQTSLDIGGKEPEKPMFTDEFLAEREAELKEKREDLQTYAPIYFNQDGNKWECIGCDEMVNPMTGKCQCYEKICMLCAEFAGNCKCESGFSLNLVMFDNAPEQYQEWAMIEVMGLPKTGTAPFDDAPF